MREGACPGRRGRGVQADWLRRLGEWLAELGVRPGLGKVLPMREIAPQLAVDGPLPGVRRRDRAFDARYYGRRRRDGKGWPPLFAESTSS